MRRRRFLVAPATVLPIALAGRSAGGSTPELPDGMTVETRHWVAEVLEDGLWHRRTERDEAPGYYYTVIEGGGEARDRIDGGEEVDEFVGATDFERSSIVVAQTVMQSARWLSLWKIERTERGIRVLATTESPDRPYGDDAAVHTLAVRVTDERGGDPGEVRVGIEGHPVESATNE